MFFSLFTGKQKKWLASAIWLLAAAVSFTACKKNDHNNNRPPQEPINVRLMKITPQTVNDSYIDSGILEGYREAVVTSSVIGEIIAITVEEGDIVKKGGVMAIIDPADYKLALQKARTLELSKRKALNRAKDLWIEKAISRSQYDDAETAFQLAQTSLEEASLNLARTKIRSPISGQVARKDRVLGDRVSPGTPFFRIVNSDLLKLVVSLSEKEVVHLNQEDEVIVLVDAYPGEPFAGRLRSVRISPTPGVASFPVEIELKNYGKLKPGMVARVKLRGQTHSGLLLVPTESVIERVGFNYVFIYEKGRAYLREVEQGRRFGDLTEIKKGLKPGDYIVPVYSSDLTDGSPVNVVGPKPAATQPG